MLDIPHLEDISSCRRPRFFKLVQSFSLFIVSFRFSFNAVNIHIIYFKYNHCLFYCCTFYQFTWDLPGKKQPHLLHLLLYTYIYSKYLSISTLHVYSCKNISLMKAVQYTSVFIKPKYNTIYYSLIIRRWCLSVFLYSCLYIYIYIYLSVFLYSCFYIYIYIRKLKG